MQTSEWRSAVVGQRRRCEVQGQQRLDPIATAPRYGRSDVVQVLLKHEGEVNAQTESQLTPLHLASRNNGNLETSIDLASGIGALKVVRLLIDRGANANRHDKRGWTLLHTASKQGILILCQWRCCCS